MIERRRTQTGIVVSDKMQKTIVVEVSRRVKHSKFQKYYTRTAKYMAHDEKSEAKVGDKVLIKESRPLSRHKRWALVNVIEKAGENL